MDEFCPLKRIQIEIREWIASRGVKGWKQKIRRKSR